jgi:hypothetical protein
MRGPFVIAAIFLGSSVALCVDAPDVRLNVASGFVEVVDAAWSGSNYNVRYTQAMTDGDPKGSTLLTTNTANDVDPRIASAPNGDAYVTWWRDLKTDAVIYRKRNFATGVWGAERILGRATESGSHPRIVDFGSRACVAYQIQNIKSRSVGAQIIDDDPEPFRSIVATTSFTGDLDIQLDSEMNHLWVTWLDSASSVGYSEYHRETSLWDLPSYEPLASDSVADVRSRIRINVLQIASAN